MWFDTISKFCFWDHLVTCAGSVSYRGAVGCPGLGGGKWISPGGKLILSSLPWASTMLIKESLVYPLSKEMFPCLCSRNKADHCTESRCRSFLDSELLLVKPIFLKQSDFPMPVTDLPIAKSSDLCQSDSFMILLMNFPFYASCLISNARDLTKQR